MGTLVVPYDRSSADSENIALKFVRFPATTDDPGPPLVYLAGGPGGSGIGAATGRRFELFMKLRELGDVIAWDQRGTGQSEPHVRIQATIDIPLEGAVPREWIEEQYARVANEAWASARVPSREIAFWASSSTFSRASSRVIPSGRKS